MAVPLWEQQQDLARIVLANLEHQNHWTRLQLHDPSHVSSTKPSRPRVLISGLPPTRMYVHPDEQVAIIRAERNLPAGQRIPQPPELEWVLPVHLQERPSIAHFAAIFDSIDALPPDAGSAVQEAGLPDTTEGEWEQWRGPKRGKRLLLAVVDDDSTVVYYFMHDGIVKPRQN